MLKIDKIYLELHMLPLVEDMPPVDLDTWVLLDMELVLRLAYAVHLPLKISSWWKNAVGTRPLLAHSMLLNNLQKQPARFLLCSRKINVPSPMNKNCSTGGVLFSHTLNNFCSTMWIKNRSSFQKDTYTISSTISPQTVEKGCLSSFFANTCAW